MTFLEAAIAILSREGRPLHYKKLTEIALKDNLLTVVGRTPEATMQQRLNDALKKNDPSLLLTREKPGVFGLRYYPQRRAAERADAGAEPPRPSEDGVRAVEARPPVEGEGAAPAEERKRRRRRGGRGRRRGGGGEETAATEPASEATEMEPSPVETAAATAPSAGIAEEPARADAEAVERAAPSENGANGAPIESPTALAPTAAIDGLQPARPEPRQPTAPPERRSFAEAAAEVAAAHRQRAASERGEPPPTVTATSEVEERMEPASRTADGGALASTEPVAAPPPVAPPDEPVVSAAPAAEDELITDELEPLADEEAALFDEDDLEQPSGPLIAPAFGTEELVRGEDHRPLVEEPARGRRDRRDRRRDRGGRERPERSEEARAEARPSPRPEQRPQRPERRDAERRDAERRDAERRDAERREVEPARAEPEAREVEPRRPSPVESAPGATPSAIDAVVEVLRACEGRSVHARQIVEMALKRKLLRGDAAELVRVVRGAVLAELREREATGLRPRVRPVGGSSYALADRKLEGDLAQQERELGERARRLTESTRAALLRRIARLGTPEFEALMRLLLARLGAPNLELVKRGDGVAYFGGQRVARGRRRRVLVALRPGEAAVGRRAVGELRAGLEARGFDEGLLLAAGTAAPEALAELRAGGVVELFDGEALAALCAEQGIGVLRRAIAVDALDVELFAEIAADRE